MKRIRNFWIAADIDGRKTPVSGGPIDTDGGFDATVYQRHKGKAVVAARISGFVTENGALHLTIRARDGDSLPIVATVETCGG